MKICIVSQGKDLEAEIDSRFGRCRYFIFYDTETGEKEVVENTWREAVQGAGVQAAQFVASKGVQVLVTGGKLGPKAERIIGSAKIKILEVSGKVIDGINQVKNLS
ncbi:NifB/NifX family molybdenum-iron cluster-binding protein [Thermodesulfobacterium commune]|uniref:NifB/NifX family molybdenum-iron cluster-binding protein n=1 Tax=Thermodesulfobacterium commune TaxID=1741 RepID=UPI002FDB87D4